MVMMGMKTFSLPRWNWSWAGELFIKLYRLRISRQVANRLLVCFRRKRTRVVTNQFMVFLEERRILKTLAQGFFDDFHPILGHGWRKNKWRAGQTEIAKHDHYFAFPLGFGEAVNFRQIGKLRMLIFSRNSKDEMEIDETFFKPLRLAIQQPTVGYGDGIDLTAHQSNSPFRIRKAGDVLNFFEAEEPGH